MYRRFISVMERHKIDNQAVKTFVENALKMQCHEIFKFMLLNFNQLSWLESDINSYICALKIKSTNFNTKQDDESRYRSENFGEIGSRER